MRDKIARMGIGALVLLLSAPAGWAGSPQPAVDRTRAHVVTRHTPAPRDVERPQVQRVVLTPYEQLDGAVHIVQNEVVEPAATVSRELSEQPVHPHLAHVVVVNTPITVDPERNFDRPTGGIDEDHYLRRAQRIQSRWLSRKAARPARVIRNPHLTPSSRPQSQSITPRAIIHIPDHLEQQSPEQPSHPPIPSVPAPPRQEKDLQPSLVRAD